jgi:uncharacterized protein (DUF305 family)
MNTSAELSPREPDDTLEQSRLLWPILLAVALGALLVGALGGYLLRGARTPTADSVDVGFARDMSVHHEQAVQMAALVYDRSDDPAIRSLAFDILTTQQGQIGIMSGWLDAWGVPWTSAEPRMAWMGMPVEGLMPGMATAQQMNSLREAAGAAADIVFLQLMIPHHRAGVDMAAAAFDRAATEPVRLLAGSILEAQNLEIDYMQELLQAKGQAPAPDTPADDTHDHNAP